MRQKYWGPSLFNPNSPHYSSDDSYPAGLLTVEIAEQFLADNDSVDLSQFTSIKDAAPEAIAKHEGDIYFNHDQLPPSASKILKDAGH